jgi:hypothetical protein
VTLLFVIARLAKPAEAISEGEILNPKHQTPNAKQYQMTKPNLDLIGTSPKLK